MKKALLVILITFVFAVFAGVSFAAEKSETDLAIEKLMRDLEKNDGESAQPTAPAVQPAQEPQTASSPAEALPGRPKAPGKLSAGTPETYDSLIVDVDWLAKNIKNVVLIDTRPESNYATAHLTGAVNATWTYFANVNVPTGTMKYGTLYDAATMAKRIGALGIDGNKQVVVYDDGAGWGQAGYVTTIMRMSGIKNAKILNGGITAWRKQGQKVSTTKHTNKAVKLTIKEYSPNYVINTKWIDDNIGKAGFKLVDVRTPQEYKGMIRPFAEKRAGHLPTAINIPMGEFSTPEFKWKSAGEIKSILTAAGIEPGDEVVVYDTVGVRAANVLMMLRLSGYVNSRFYDEGYQAWAGDSKCEIVK